MFYLIPIANVIVSLFVVIEMAQVFGKSTGFGIGLFPLDFVFGPILAFDDSENWGPVNATA